MAKYCSNCGSEVNDQAVVCIRCGCAVQNVQQSQYQQPYQQPYQGSYQQSHQQAYQQPYQQPYGQPYGRPAYPQPMNGPKKTQTSLILGIVGIVFAWLFALVGHITSIIGIVLGIKEYKETNNIAGLTLSIIGEVCSVISSLIGIAMMGLLWS